MLIWLFPNQELHRQKISWESLVDSSKCLDYDLFFRYKSNKTCLNDMIVTVVYLQLVWNLYKFEHGSSGSEASRMMLEKNFRWHDDDGTVSIQYPKLSYRTKVSVYTTSVNDVHSTLIKVGILLYRFRHSLMHTNISSMLHPLVPSYEHKFYGNEVAQKAYAYSNSSTTKSRLREVYGDITVLWDNLIKMST